MAIWAGSSISTDNSAWLFNKIALPKAVKIGRVANPLMAFFMNKFDLDDEGKWLQHPSLSDRGTAGVKLLPSGGGKKIEVTLAAAKALYSGKGYGANERAAVSIAGSDAGYGAAEFDIAAFYELEPWDKSKFDRYKGKERKLQLEFLSSEFDLILEAWHKTLDTRLSDTSAAAPSTTVVGSALNALIANTYGTIDRTDVANADFKAAEVDTATTAITLAKMRRKKTKCMIRRAKHVVVWAAEEAYGLIGDKIEAAAGYEATQLKDKTVEYSGEYFVYNGMAICLAPKLGAGNVMFLNPESWQVYLSEDGMATTTGVQQHPNFAHQMYMQWDSYVQVLCFDPGTNACFTAIAS